MNPRPLPLSPLIIKIVIPAYNEEHALPLVLSELPPGWADEVVVADNLSTDRTAAVARAAGATVVRAAPRGYGAACLAALAHLEDRPWDLVVFLDGDHSDFPAELPDLVAPILRGDADFVVGSRSTGARQPGAMFPQQLFGNWLATTLIEILFRKRYTDLGPFRAITREALGSLGMCDRNWGWTVEMQIKAVIAGLRIAEVPVSYRPRIGKSKIAGTLRGTIAAGNKILYTVGKLYFETRILRRHPRCAATRRSGRRVGSSALVGMLA